MGINEHFINKKMKGYTNKIAYVSAVNFLKALKWYQ